MTESQVVIVSHGLPLLGMLYQPAGEALGGWLFGDPAFEERKAAQRNLVELARELAGAGQVVLRFDYRGCGDSGGDLADFAIGDWLADLLVCRDWLGHRFPGLGLGLFGLRLGASLACLAAAQTPGLRGLCLWAPVADGRAYLLAELRKRLMKEMVTFGSSRSSREELMAELESGATVDLDGYALTARFYRELVDLDLAMAVPHFGDFPVAMVGIEPSGRESADCQALAEWLGGRPSRLWRKTLRMPQCWNQIGHVDGRELVAATLAAMREGQE